MKTKKTGVMLTAMAVLLSAAVGCAKQSDDTDKSANQDSAVSETQASGASEQQSGDKVQDAEINPDEKIQIVMECQNSHLRDDFEKNLEKQFPNIDLIVRYNYSANVMFSLQQNLSHGLAPDMYINEFLPNLGDSMLSEYFYDLASQGFIDRYYLSAIEGCSTADGGLYYLPGPSYVYGIIYDKTMFEELGLKLPTNYSEFAKLCSDINAMGLKGYEPDPADSTRTIEVPVEAFVPTIMWPDMFQIIFNTLNYEDYFRGMQNAKWLADYQEGSGSMIGHMEGAAEKYMKLFDDGILSLDYWNTKPFYRTQKLYQYHTSLMTIECQQGFEYNETYGMKEPYEHHEIGIMPIFTSDNPDSGYLYGIPRSYFGITRQGAEDPEKLEAMLEIFDYLSLVDGQKNLISGPDYFGFLKNDETIDGPLYSDVADEIYEDRVITRFFMGGKGSRGRVESYLHEHTPELVNGEITIEEWLKGADEVRDSIINPEPPKVYGKATETLQPVQTAYVDALALLHSIDADIAFVQSGNNYGTVQYMFSGDITDLYIKFISPEITSVAQPVEGDMEYVVVEMTGEQLLELASANHRDSLAAFAGVEMELDLSKEGKEQYVSLMIDGKPMDMEKTYRVAAIRGSVPGYTPVEEYKELHFSDMFISYLESVNGEITPPKQLKLINGED